MYALALHRLAYLGVAAAAEADRLIEALREHAGAIVITLQELAPVWNVLLFQAEHHLVDKGQSLARIGEQTLGRVLRLALRGIALVAEVRVALEHHAPVRIVHREHIGPRAHRIPVEREIFLRHAG